MTNREKWKQSNLRRIFQRTFTPFGFISFIVLALYAVSLLFPLIWSVITSFREPTRFLIDKFMGFGMWPQEWGNPLTWENNYAKVFKNFGLIKYIDKVPTKIGFAEQLGNSILYSIGSAILGTATSLLVAYAASVFKFRACKVVYTIVIIQMILPIVGSFPSEIKMMTSLGLFDTMIGAWIMKTYVSGLHFLIFYSSFKLIPKEYAEAAELDGAGNLRIMWNVLFPFVKGSIFTIFLLKFIGFWNDYQTPLLYMPSLPTLAYGVYDFTRGSITSDTPTQLAATMLMAVPLFIIFIAFQKRLLGDLSVGGLK